MTAVMVQELEPLSMEAIGEAIADIVGELEPEEPEEVEELVVAAGFEVILNLGRVFKDSGETPTSAKYFKTAWRSA